MARGPTPQISREVMPEVGPSTGVQARVARADIDFPSLPAEAFGAASAQGLQNLGAGAMRLANFMSQVAVDDQFNKFEQNANILLHGDPSKKVQGPDGREMADTGYLGLQGRAALDKRQEVQETLKKMAEEAGVGLVTPEQRFAYRRATQSYLNNADARIGVHARNEERGWAETVQVATMKTQLERIGAAPHDEQGFLQARDDLRAASIKRLQIKFGANPGPELVNDAIATADREAAKTRIMSIGATEPNRALAMAEANKKELGSDYDNVYLTLRPRADDQLGKDYVRRQFAQGEPVPAGSDAKALLRHFEGFRPDTYWDVNHHRTGYGSDTITKSDGTVVEVKQGMTVTKEDAERDLERRAAISMGQVKRAAGDAWDKLDNNTRAALASIAYNYGSVPDRLAGAIKTGEKEKIAEAVRGLQGDNGGVNRGRRNKEADFILGRAGTSYPTAPSEVGLIQKIKDDPVFNGREAARDTAIAYTTQQISKFNADRAAQIKSLNDTFETAQTVIQLAPNAYKDGTFMQIAEGYRQAGDMSNYAVAVFMAQNEANIKILATSPKSAQDKIIAAMMTGKAKALADSRIAATGQEAVEAGKVAHAEFSAIKEAITGQSAIPVETMTEKIKAAVNLAAKSNDPLLATQIVDFVSAAKTGSWVQGVGPVQQQALIAELRNRVMQGQQDNGMLHQLKFLNDMVDRQTKEYKDDPLATGARLQNIALQPIPWDGPADKIADAFSRRGMAANQVSASRDGLFVPLVTNEEMAQLKNRLKAANPQRQEEIFRGLSGMPDEKKNDFAAALAGKNSTGDFLTNSYAASLSLFSSKAPEDQAAASKILRGAEIRKSEGTKSPATEGIAWNTALQDALGNVFRDSGRGTPAVVKDAIASVYVHDMFMQGKTGDAAPDPDVLGNAIKQVVGATLERGGQRFFPPVRGMTSYDVDKTLSQLQDGDLQGLRTTEGKPVTADAIRRSTTQFSSIQDGVYVVRVPDGRNGIPSEILDYSRPDEFGRPTAFRLDMRPLVERAQRFGTIPMNIEENNTPTGMRRDVGRRFAPMPEPR